MSTSRIATDMMNAVRKSSEPVRRSINPRKPLNSSNVRRSLRQSKQELAVRFAKDLLTQGQHLQHKSSLEHLSQALAGSGLINLRTHYNPSPLSSASLLASFLKHRLIRNQESITSPVIRKIVGMAEMKNSLWSHTTSQLPRKIQFSQVLAQLNLDKELIQTQLEFAPDNSGLLKRLSSLDSTIRRTEMLIDNLEPTIKGNLHPDSLLVGDKASMTPSEAALLPSPASTIRGILIRIKGPRKGNRAMKQQKSCGRVSINSVGLVNYEECSIQLPSKLGIYGLYVRFVYNKTDRLISPYSKVPVHGEPTFKFKEI